MSQRRAANEKQGREDYLKQRGYEIVQKIDSGGQGTVYQARKEERGLVALKVIKIKRKHKHKGDDLQLDLQRELTIISKIRHPNIIEIYEILRTKHKVYIFMEYAECGTLGSLVRKNGPLPEDVCKSYFRPIVSALLYLHENSIAHRDLKLDNVLLDRKKTPKLTDFGYSRFVESNSPVDTLVGSPSYYPPEIIDKVESYNPYLVDVWCLGICLFSMLNESYPFDRRDRRKMRQNQGNKNYHFQKDVDRKISAEVKDLVSKMLEPDVKKRIELKSISHHKWLKVDN